MGSACCIKVIQHNFTRLNAFSRPIKHIAHIQLIFFVICFKINIASVHDLPDLNPCYSSAKGVKLIRKYFCCKFQCSA